MSIPTAEEFVQLFGNNSNQVKRNSPSTETVLIKFAEIVDVNDPEGKPRIRFEGETTASAKRYPYLGSYTPTVGDAVMVVHGVVQHKIIGKRM